MIYGYAYGAPGPTNTGNFQYTGQAWNADLGLCFYKNRFYDPHLRVFTSTDPIGHSGGINLYAYVGGDPVNFVDPWGLSADCPADTVPDGNGGCIADTDDVIVVTSRVLCDDACWAERKRERSFRFAVDMDLADGSFDAREFVNSGGANSGDGNSSNPGPGNETNQERHCRHLRERRDSWNDVGDASTAIGAGGAVVALVAAGFFPPSAILSGTLLFAGGMTAGAGGASIERRMYYNEQLRLNGCRLENGG